MWFVGLLVGEIFFIFLKLYCVDNLNSALDTIYRFDIMLTNNFELANVSYLDSYVVQQNF